MNPEHLFALPQRGWNKGRENRKDEKSYIWQFQMQYIATDNHSVLYRKSFIMKSRRRSTETNKEVILLEVNMKKKCFFFKGDRVGINKEDLQFGQGVNNFPLRFEKDQIFLRRSIVL